MKPRRHRFFREDTVAPWVTLAVIIGFWWLGARALGLNEAGKVPSVETPVTLPTASSSTPPGDERPTTIGAGTPPPSAGERVNVPPAKTANPSADPVKVAPSMSARGGDIDALLAQRLVIPVAGVEASSLRSMFDQARGGGSRVHEAIDLLAPRGTPVVAALDGRVVKLFTSAAGGLTIYQFDPAEQFCYYYAHLDRYVPNLAEGQLVTRGQVIGYVGTTGNAPPDTPHLHFAILKLGPEKEWWGGDPIDPFLVLR